MKKVSFFLGLLLAILLPWLWQIRASAAQNVITVTIPTDPIAESKDYATLVLGDPWDLNEFSDISQYFNANYGAPSPDNPFYFPRDPVVKDYSIENGLYSGTSIGTVFDGKNGWFTPLFPGYETAVHLGRMGSRYPINSATYGCFYIALKTNSGANRATGGPDQYRLFWFANEKLNTDIYGVSVGEALYPEIPGTGRVPTPRWQVLKIDLRTVNVVPGTASWSSQSQWQGLRFEPTIQDNVAYQVDWMRLTDCTPQYVTITFTPDANVASLWLRPEGSTRDILVAKDVDGNSGTYRLDTQGLAPGRYQVGLGTGSAVLVPPTCCSQRSTAFITINQTPIVQYQNPTFASGEDIASSLGNPWDFQDNSDYYGITCADYGFEAPGMLWLNTADLDHQPPACKSDVGAARVSDPSVYLTMSQPFESSPYRYLTYRMLTDNSLQDIPNGMIVRWVWSIQGSSGRQGYMCHIVTQDIPYDVGWHTYTVDLWDPFSGSAEEFAGECDGGITTWRESGQVLQLRFDPNENITGETLYQKIDWIRLTKPIVITRGQAYTLSLNKFFPGDTFDTVLYYTNNLNQPTQNRVILYTPPTPAPAGPQAIYLPMLRKDGAASTEPGDLNFNWNTTTVNPGEYYICAQVDDGVNQAIFCSEATITVTE
jgi:hypothetical protein